MGRYIDADALIEAMGEEPYVWTDSAEEIAERNQWLTDMGIIENAPTIDAVPSADRPQGEWIDAEIPLESGGSMPIQVCNLCKTFYPLAYTGGGHRFCPNCGARMKGADDE